jgi:lipopolysaccharide/colanic/teichoic acid biosynthesis glycosyltransferase
MIAMDAKRYYAPSGSSLTTRMLKRLFDIAGAVVGLVVLAPLFAAVAIAIKIRSPGPVMFRQERVGRGGRPFRIFKFRTMATDRASMGSALTFRDDKRVTSIGRFLRKTKLDELPQLLNVLGGSMSFVGPRPEVPQFMQFYTPTQRVIIQSMRPGITDYASILFRDENSLLDQQGDPLEIYRYQIMPIKFLYYERYSRNIGIVTDLQIILGTLLKLALGRCPRWLRLPDDLEFQSQPLQAQWASRRSLSSGRLPRAS